MTKRVIRPFGLNDIFLMLSLQHNSVALAIEHILTHPRTPLWIALTAPWPWAAIGVATYVLRDRHPEGAQPLTGFVQLMKRSARPEADLLHLAPAFSGFEGDEAVTEKTWERLLAHSSSAAAAHGLLRVFASIHDGGIGETYLKNACFSLFTREAIHRLAVLPDFARYEESSPAGLRPQLPQDSWALQRLYTRGTPRLVQQAEGGVTGQVGSPPLSWWEPDRWQGIVWEPAGEVRGAVQVHCGRAGHWLRICGINVLTQRELRVLMTEGLRMLRRAGPGSARDRPLPVYTTVRDYEIGASSVLTGFGFAPYMDRARFVRHIVAAIPRSELARAPTVAVAAGARR